MVEPLSPQEKTRPFFPLLKDATVQEDSSPLLKGKKLEELAEKKKWYSSKVLDQLYNIFGLNVCIKLKQDDKTGFYIPTETAKKIIILAAKKINPEENPTISTKKIGRLFAAAMAILTKTSIDEPQPPTSETPLTYLSKELSLKKPIQPSVVIHPAPVAPISPQAPIGPPSAAPTPVTTISSQAPIAPPQAPIGPPPGSPPPQKLIQKYPPSNWSIQAVYIKPGKNGFVVTSKTSPLKIHVYDQHGSLYVKESLEKMYPGCSLTYQGLKKPDQQYLSFKEIATSTDISYHDLAFACLTLQEESPKTMPEHPENMDPICLTCMYRIYLFPSEQEKISPDLQQRLKTLFKNTETVQRMNTSTDTGEPITSLVQYLIQNKETLRQILPLKSYPEVPQNSFSWIQYILGKVIENDPDPKNFSAINTYSSHFLETLKTIYKKLQSPQAPLIVPPPASAPSLPGTPQIPATSQPQPQIPSFIVAESTTPQQPQQQAEPPKIDVVTVDTVKSFLHPTTGAVGNLDQLAETIQRNWQQLSWDDRADIAREIQSFLKLNKPPEGSKISFIYNLEYLTPVSVESAYRTAKDLYKDAINGSKTVEEITRKANDWIAYCVTQIANAKLPIYYRQEFLHIKQLYEKLLQLPGYFTPTLATSSHIEELFKAELAEIKQAIANAEKGTLSFVNFTFTNTPILIQKNELWTTTLGELVIMFQDFSQSPLTSQAQAQELLAEITKLKSSSWYKMFQLPFFNGIKTQLEVIEKVLREKAGQSIAPGPQPAASVSAPDQETLQTTLKAFQEVDSSTTKESLILPPKKLQEIRTTQKTENRIYEGDMREEVTKYYSQHPTQTPPVLSAKDDAVPESYARQLLTGKRKDSVGKKLTSFREEFRARHYDNLEQIQRLTNMDAAMQLLLVQVTPVEAYEDYFYDTTQFVHASKPIENGLCRKILIDNAIMPDLELGGVDEVYGRILRFNGIKGAPLPQDFHLLTPEEMENPAKVKEHDETVEKALIYTFAGAEGFGECRGDPLSVPEAIARIKTLLQGNETPERIVQQLKGLGVRTQDGVVRPLEGFYQVMFHQLQTRTKLYEGVSGENGYILTIDPPGIFINQLGGYSGPAGELLPLLGALAIKRLKTTCPKLQAVAVSAGKFNDLIPFYQKAMGGDPGKVHNKSTEVVQSICEKHPHAAYGATFNGDGHGKNFLKENASGHDLKPFFGSGSLEGQMAAIAPCPQLDQKDPGKIVFITPPKEF